MSALTNFAENKIIDWLFRGQALGITGASAGAGSGPTNLYFGLLTAAPTDAGGGTEVTGGSYARVAMTSNMTNWAGTQGAGTTAVSSGTSGVTSNNTAITFQAPTANWGSIVAVVVYDALTGGNPLIYSTLNVPKTVNNGDAAPSFAIGSLTFQIDN